MYMGDKKLSLYLGKPFFQVLSPAPTGDVAGMISGAGVMTSSTLKANWVQIAMTKELDWMIGALAVALVRFSFIFSAGYIPKRKC